MNSKIFLITEAAGIGLSLAALITSLVVFRKTRRLLSASAKLEVWIDGELNSISHDVDTVSRKSAEHGRRVAWLESRARSSQFQNKTVTETVQATAPKLTITERRHRVLSLARRGQDPQTIARTLGMPDGEVELMINLGRAA